MDRHQPSPCILDKLDTLKEDQTNFWWVFAVEMRSYSRPIKIERQPMLEDFPSKILSLTNLIAIQSMQSESCLSEGYLDLDKKSVISQYQNSFVPQLVGHFFARSQFITSKRDQKLIKRFHGCEYVVLKSCSCETTGSLGSDPATAAVERRHSVWWLRLRWTMGGRWPPFVARDGEFEISLGGWARPSNPSNASK